MQGCNTQIMMEMEGLVRLRGLGLLCGSTEAAGHAGHYRRIPPQFPITATSFKTMFGRLGDDVEKKG